MQRRIVPIEEFPGYFVSDDGKVYSEKRGDRKVLKFMLVDRRPYVRMYSSKGAIMKRVSVLVANAFVPKPSDKGRYRVVVKDGDRANLVSYNLEWVADTRGSTKAALKNRKTILEILTLYYSQEQKVGKIADQYGVSVPAISCIIQGKSYPEVFNSEKAQSMIHKSKITFKSKPRLTEDTKVGIRQMIIAGIPSADIAAMYNVSYVAVYRMKKELELTY